MLNPSNNLPAASQSIPPEESRGESSAGWPAPLALSTLFASTLFLSATLLFWVQPMIAKMLLPLLGGAPAVWNTCMVFFQAMLLAGYAYAHWLTTRLSAGRQALLHLALLCFAAIALPIQVSQAQTAALPVASDPTLWLLGCLLITAGLPFFVVSTSAPLLQRWFSQTRHPSARDPYFLYAASNCGSLAALLGYPLLLEPFLRLPAQRGLWAAGYAALGVSVALCAFFFWKSRLNVTGASEPVKAANPSHEPPPHSPARTKPLRRGEGPSSRHPLPHWERGKGEGEVQGLKTLSPDSENPPNEPTPSPLPGGDLATGTSSIAPLLGEAGGGFGGELDSVNSLPLRTGEGAAAERHARSLASEKPLPEGEAALSAPTPMHRLMWVLLAFVPSSLMLGVTTYLTTDIASIPLLWVLPLSLYLLTFVLVFARRSLLSQRLIERALPAAAIALCYLLLSEATEPVWLLLLLHLAFFFLASMVCHGRLAQSRPHPQFLTEFYFWISVGGVLGGLFNALLAPTLFSRVLEYPLAAVAACFFRTGLAGPSFHQAWKPSDVVAPLAVGLFTVTIITFVPGTVPLLLSLQTVLIFGLPLLVSYFLVDRPVRFGLSLGAVLLAGSFHAGSHGQTLHVERNFFGVLRVTRDPLGEFHRLVHGNTIHGRQFTDPARQCEPLSYYHRTGPLGQLFQIFHRQGSGSNIAVVGLGAGAAVCYARPQETWTIYEINPAVIELAQNTNYFTFLPRCTSGEMILVLGDARLRLREAAPGSFDLMILDAFSSDAIPMHLVTREALELYLEKLAEGGLLAFHISNRSLDLEPVLGDLAQDAGLLCFVQDETDPAPEDEGKDQSQWVVMARRSQDLGRMAKDSRWQPVSARPRPEIWTDDFSNIIRVFRWK